MFGGPRIGARLQGLVCCCELHGCLQLFVVVGSWGRLGCRRLLLEAVVSFASEWRRAAGYLLPGRALRGRRPDEVLAARAFHGARDHCRGLAVGHAVVGEGGLHAEAFEELAQAPAGRREVAAEEALQRAVAVGERAQARSSTSGSVNEQAMPCGRPWRKVIS
jgi:hypothetical protein